jgi:hypothetical protein
LLNFNKNFPAMTCGTFTSRRFWRLPLPFLALLFACCTFQPGHAQWAPTNGPPGGNVYSLLAVDSVVFAGTNGAGIIASADHGLNWTPSNTGLPELMVFSLARRGNDLYAGCQYVICRSADNGNSWTGVYQQPTYQDNSLLATNDSTIFATSRGVGILRSDDNGLTWTPSNTGLPSADIQALFADAGYIFAGVHHCGLYRSNDNGLTWNSVGFSGATPFAMNRAGGLLFCGVDNKIWRSANDGVTWTEMLSTGSNILAIVSDFTGLYAGTCCDGIYFSADNGGTWAQKNNGLEDQQVNALAFSGPALVAGTYSLATARSLDHGNSWETTNCGMGNQLITALCSSGNRLYTGSWGAGVFTSGDGGVTWQDLGLQEHGESVLAIAGKDTLIFASGVSGLFRRTLASAGWVKLTGFPDFYVTTLVVKGNWLLAGTWNGGLFRSADNGLTWQACTGCFNMSEITDIEVKGDTIFAYVSNDGLYSSWDDGGTWNSLGFKPGYNGAILTSNSGYLFLGSESEGMFRSPDNGISWEHINNGLLIGSWPLDIITIPGYVILAATSGIYITGNNGLLWTEAGTGLVSVGHYLRAIGDTLYCGTQFLSVWKRYLYNILDVDDPPGARQDFSVFPNPAGTLVTVRIPEGMDGNTRITLSGADGKTMVDRKITGSGKTLLDVSSLIRGLYLVRISDDKHCFSAKLVVK